MRAQAPPPGAGALPEVGAAAAILVDAQTGSVLYAKQPHARLAVASLTKVMTALVARKRYRLDELVTVTDAVAGVRGEKLGLRPGMTLSVRDLLYGLLLSSGNDAAQALAAHHPGGVTGFVEDMNAEARRLGARDSAFRNPHGLDEPGHFSTAWDMALLARRLLADPVLAAIVATPRAAISWPDGTQRVLENHNKLLVPGRRHYEGTIGVKTGYTNQAGRCLIAAARTPAGTAITVVLRSPDHYADTVRLLELFTTHPPPVGVLATPAPSPAPVPARRAAGRPAPRRASPGWALLPFGALAAAMLLTLYRPRRGDLLAEAAELHPYLEPITEE